VIVLAPKWRVNTKVDPSRLDPNLKVIISQCDMLNVDVLSVIVLNVIVLNVIVLNAMALKK